MVPWVYWLSRNHPWCVSVVVVGGLIFCLAHFLDCVTFRLYSFILDDAVVFRNSCREGIWMRFQFCRREPMEPLRRRSVHAGVAWGLAAASQVH